ncbi:MAG: hypothetical protein M1549_03615 [Candidatus Dependentiae bacterium]|nr:hypothetical protein [Candidatus Dependentiae bacterium]
MERKTAAIALAGALVALVAAAATPTIVRRSGRYTRDQCAAVCQATSNDQLGTCHYPGGSAYENERAGAGTCLCTCRQAW